MQVRSSAGLTRLRAAYELGEGGAAGATALLQVLADATASTSVRRTAMYGLVAARGLTMDGLPPVLMGRCPPEHPSASSPPTSELHGAAEGKSMDTAEGRAGAEGVDPILRLSAPPDPERWLSASLLRSVEGFDAECLLARPAAEISYLATLVLARLLAAGGRCAGFTAAVSEYLSRGDAAAHVPAKGGATAEMVALGRARCRSGASSTTIGVPHCSGSSCVPVPFCVASICPPFAALLPHACLPPCGCKLASHRRPPLAQLSAQGSSVVRRQRRQ